MDRRIVTISGVIAILSWGLASNTYAAGPTQDDLDNSTQEAKNWLYVDHDYYGQRYSPLSEINTENADQLAKITRTRAQLPLLKHVVLMQGATATGASTSGGMRTAWNAPSRSTRTTGWRGSAIACAKR